MQIDPGLNQLLERAVAPISLADASEPDCPLIAVNRRFEELTGYRSDEVVGRNCRFLQGDLDQGDVRAKIRESIENFEETQVIIRNCRKNGELFDNLLFLFPLRLKGRSDLIMGSQFRLDGPDLVDRSAARADQLVAELDRLRETKEKLVHTNRSVTSRAAAAAVNAYLTMQR